MTYPLIHPSMFEVLDALMSEARTERHSLVPGKAAGIRDLELSQFPPVRISQNDVPALFTYKTPEGIEFELQLMVQMVVGNLDDRITVLGLISHNQFDAICKPLSADVRAEIGDVQRWVAAQYFLRGRTGSVYLNGIIDGVIRLYRDQIRKAGNRHPITHTDAAPQT